jgi:hypothetical protein
VAASDWKIPLRPDRLLSRRILCDLDGLDLSKTDSISDLFLATGS